MHSSLSDRATEALVRSMPVMERNRRDLAAGMERHLTHCGSRALPSPQPEVASRVITDMLFDHARAIAGGTPLFRTGETARRHRGHGLEAAHYTCFGDGLAAVIRDVLGESASPAVLAAWVDAYWGIVRLLWRQDLAAAA
jgi:nitric oxide dioxygenase